MFYKLIVRGDTNDADYIEESNNIKEEDIDKIKKIIKVIKEYTDKKKYVHNWPDTEYDNDTVEDIYKNKLSEEEIDFMRDFIPYGEMGIHTIKEIRLLKVEEDIKLL